MKFTGTKLFNPWWFFWSCVGRCTKNNNVPDSKANRREETDACLNPSVVTNTSQIKNDKIHDLSKSTVTPVIKTKTEFRDFIRSMSSNTLSEMLHKRGERETTYSPLSIREMIVVNRWGVVKDNMHDVISPLLTEDPVAESNLHRFDRTDQHDKNCQSHDMLYRKNYNSFLNVRGTGEDSNDNPFINCSCVTDDILHKKGCLRRVKSEIFSDTRRMSITMLSRPRDITEFNRFSIKNRSHPVQNIAWKTVLDNIDEAIIITDKDGDIIFYNKKTLFFLETYHTNITDHNINDVLGYDVIKTKKNRWNTIEKVNSIEDNTSRYTTCPDRVQKTMQRCDTTDDIHNLATHSVEFTYRSPMNTTKKIRVKTRYDMDVYYIILTDTTREDKIMKGYIIEIEKNRHLMNSLLPESVIKRIQLGEREIYDSHHEVAIGFCDIVGFTNILSTTDDSVIFNKICKMYNEFDKLASELGVYKIDTAGDSYIIVCGLFDEDNENYLRVHRVIKFMHRALNIVKTHGMKIRVGIHKGDVISGVIGSSRPQFTIIGDDVNIASRMESHGVPDKIHVSCAVFNALIDSCTTIEKIVNKSDTDDDCLERYVTDRYIISKLKVKTIKGKGEMQTYLVDMKQ